MPMSGMWSSKMESLLDEKECYKEDPITYETFTSQYDNDKVMFFKYDYKKYDYSDELYWDKDNNYNYEWIDLVIKEYNLEFGDSWRFDHKHNGDGGFMFWRKHSKRPIIHSDFKICGRGHLWKARRFVKDVEGELKVIVMMVKVKSNLFCCGETFETEKERLHKKTIERLMGLGKNNDYWFKKSVIEERYRGDKKKLREIKKLHKTIFEEYKNEYGALLDKYNYSKSCYRQKAKSDLDYIKKLAYKKFPPPPLY
jgi:hypothetical protein